MADSNEVWELSKENIQPLKRGRDPGVLKVALTVHPEDLVLQQRQLFENELRTYVGDDPLSVWCKYIGWVEQNFPKGGRDGHILQLMEQCLSILRDNAKYYDDRRFIDIWLKYANMSLTATEIYNFMYSRKIGCKLSIFFTAWSWELEQQGNLKKADQVLSEGIHRKAEPLEKLKAYRSEFEMRVASKVMADSGQNGDTGENCRSAFSILKPQRKKNSAPVVRTGDAVIEPGRNTMTIGGKQPLPKSNVPSSKVPFKIYNTENLPPPLPLHSENAAPFVLYSDVSKENEKKPSKWNNVKMKQAVSSVRPIENANPGFTLHCDEAPQPSSTPRSIPKVCNVLRPRQHGSSPPRALFESPDPKKIPMYDKAKVYGGAEEFSLEEIRAAAWRKRRDENKKQKKIAEQEKILREQQEQLREQQEQIKNLVQQMQMLKTNKVSTITDENKWSEAYSAEIDNFSKCNNKNSQELKCTSQRELFSDHKLTSTYSDASHMIRDLYNETFANVRDFSNSEHAERKGSPEFQTRNSAFEDLGGHRVNHDVSLEKNAQWCQNSVISKENADLPFMLYRDPTEDIRQQTGYAAPNSFNQAHPGPYSSSNEIDKENEENVPPKGYIQESNKRELNGILEPSKNVMFVPLELQEMEEEEEEEDDDEVEQHGVYKENNNHPLQDQTLIPPSNTEQFVTAVCLASTPRTQLKRLHLADSSSEGVKQTDFKSCDPGDYYNPAPQKVPSQDMKQICKNEVRTAKDQSTFPGLPAQLSVIMETSRECYKSSSSSGSSQSTTKLSQFSQCLSHEKSNIQRHFSRFDTFREPKPICKTSDLSANTNEGAFKEPRPVAHLSETSSMMMDQYNGSKEPRPAAHKTSFLSNSSKRDGNLEEDEFEIHISSIDPFDSQVTTRILESLHPSPDHFRKLQIFNKKLITLKGGDHLNFGNMTCEVKHLVSEGGFGKVYEAAIECSYQQNMHEMSSTVALKVCKNVNDWEFYICNALRERLTHRKELPDIRMSVMEVIFAQRYSNGIILASEFSHHGTLLDLVNFYKKQNLLMPETISMYLTLEMLQIISEIHSCGIIHADVKPENILMRNNVSDFDVLNLMEKKTILLKLIDFGRAIDVQAEMFKKGVCFTTIVSDNCIEMRENKPWVFQLDWFGFLNSVHVLLFSEYMKVTKNSVGKWAIEKKFKRYWDQTIWVPLFDELLNIPSCYQEPNVEKFSNLIKSKLRLSTQTFRTQFQRLLLFYEEKI